LAQPKRVQFGRNACSFSLLFFFRFWDGFLSGFAFSDAKTTEKPHDIAIEDIKHARHCVFDV
jgi:hypothetical protein